MTVQIIPDFLISQ